MNLHNIRLSLIFLFIGLGILIHLQTGFTPAWYLYLAALILLATHFLYANVWTAFSLLRRGKPLEAEVALSKISRPNWLAKSPKAYYHFTKGMIHLQNKDITQAKQHLNQAKVLGLRNNNDNALATLNLAHISYVEKDQAQAKQLLEAAQAFQPNDLMIKDNIEKMRKALG